MVLKRNKEKSEFLFLDVRFKMVTIHRVQQFLSINLLKPTCKTLKIIIYKKFIRKGTCLIHNGIIQVCIFKNNCPKGPELPVEKNIFKKK